jgi:hypothetical protein
MKTAIAFGNSEKNQARQKIGAVSGLVHAFIFTTTS